MPVEVGDTFFMCLGWDQRNEQRQKMVDHGKLKAEEMLAAMRRGNE